MNPAWSQDRFNLAWTFAASAHEGQRFPGRDLPYIVHIASVAQEVMAALTAEPRPHGELSVLCALLHDTVEDTPVTLDQLVTTFGPAVAAGVSALTKDDDLPKEARMADSLSRLRAQPNAVQLVKLADRITNLDEPPHYWTNEKRLAYQAEARQILDALADSSAYLAGRLTQRITDYSRYIG